MPVIPPGGQVWKAAPVAALGWMSLSNPDANRPRASAAIAYYLTGRFRDRFLPSARQLPPDLKGDEISPRNTSAGDSPRGIICRFVFQGSPTFVTVKLNVAPVP